MINGRVDVITLGCSKNLVDSEQLMRQFSALNYEVVHDAPEVSGEVVVVNTCGFIGDAKEESIEMILELCEAKHDGRVGKVFVMGCLSQRYLEDLKCEIPEVDGFYGKFDWKGLIADLGHSYNAELRNERVITTPSHYAYVKIAEGCNRCCAYCAIPIITGRYQSRPIEEICDEVRHLVSCGVREFQVIAQDLTYYGKDIYREYSIARLVEEMAQIEGVEWIRLHYAYPAHFPYDLLPVMAKYENVCSYLDIALQHISDNMLKLMHRHVTKAETLELLHRIRQEVPNIHLRTTLMVGHPGESETDFEELKTFVREAKFERMGAFAYSEEEGTYSAKHYSDDIPQEVKEARLAEIMEIQEGIATESNLKKVGMVMGVRIDRLEGDYYVGRTEFDSPEVDPEVLIAAEGCDELEIGVMYRTKIVSAQPFELYGEIF